MLCLLKIVIEKIFRLLFKTFLFSKLQSNDYATKSKYLLMSNE